MSEFDATQNDDIQVRVVLPRVSDEPVADMLRLITEAIEALNPDAVAHGFLGGESGYGAEWDNDVFSMRPFYWGDCDCGADERDEPHTAACALELPNFVHKRTGMKVYWYKYIGRGMEVKKAPSDLSAIFAECIDSLKATP